jgi:subtilisin
MAQEKDERPGVTARKPLEADDSTRRAPGPPGRTGTREAAGSVSANGELSATPPGRRRERYLIGMRTAPDGAAFAAHEYARSMDEVIEYLSRQENVEVIKRIKLGAAQPFTAAGRGVNDVAVAKIEESKAQQLRSAAPSHLIIERDALLSCADYVPAPWGMPLGSLLPLRSVASEVSIRVIGERDQPLARATVVIDGGGLPAQALTDETGTARITFFGGSLESIRALFIRAAANHWDRLIAAPRLSTGTNTVRLRSLSQSYANFPNERLLGWGQRLMGLDPTNARVSGRGVRIGIIDSGCDSSHPLLRQVTHGRDFTPGAADTNWTEDLVSHGTHCSALICASSSAEQGIFGCAPEAELHVFKVIPGGRLSDLLAAIDECIERELDLINLGVVSDGFSELVNQKLQEARHKGIACIVAAGNSGGPVAFPATLPGVMAVAAVGKLREFPADSSHALTVIPQLVGGDEIFVASFSGAGPQIALCAPGVAVVSAVAGGGYAAADGTSVAAAHVSGFAALVLAHHPLFKEGPFRVRSERRVHALFELVRGSAVARYPDMLRGGAGVPDLRRVPGNASLVMGFPIPDAAAGGRFAMPQYWPPVSPHGSPGWTTLQPPAAGFL